MTRLACLVLVSALVAACASADSKQPPPRPTKELAAGGARIRGGGIRMDVQLGRGQVRRPGNAGSISITPHAVVTP